jgi:hypothetical protein
MFIDAASSDLLFLTEATSNSSVFAVVIGAGAVGDAVPGNVCIWPNTTGSTMPKNPATANNRPLPKSSLRVPRPFMAWLLVNSIPLTPQTQARDYPLASISGGVSTSWMPMVSACSRGREFKGRCAPWYLRTALPLNLIRPQFQSWGPCRSRSDSKATSFGSRFCFEGTHLSHDSV